MQILFQYVYIVLYIQVFRGISVDNSTLMKKTGLFSPIRFHAAEHWFGGKEGGKEAAILALLSLT